MVEVIFTEFLKVYYSNLIIMQFADEVIHIIRVRERRVSPLWGVVDLSILQRIKCARFQERLFFS
jgi:hypothetical protein